MNRGRKKPISLSNWQLWGSAIAISLTGVTIFVLSKSPTLLGLMRDTSSTPVNKAIFSNDYPVAEDFQKELKRLLDSKKVEPANEKLIREWATASATDMHMPPAMLWCLFFQESRLHHLQGSQTSSPAKGLGQFLSSTFYEVNNQLDRFTPINSQILIRRMGRDVRPVSAIAMRKTNLSSYYHIPTAVVSSAAYLNNRYHQLNRNLKARGIDPDPNLLWLYSAMAYNKGTRSVLSFWNEAYRDGGIDAIRNLTTDFKAFHSAVDKQPKIARALRKVWEKNKAARYATELRIHLANIARCSLRPDPPEAVSKGAIQ